MENKKIITVFGATGAQGGGLALAILTDKNSEFKLRAVTRNPNSEKAQTLKRLGAEIVEAGLPVTLLRTSFYWDNLIHFGMGPKKAQDGKYYITMPMDDKKLAGIASEDIGKCAYGIFKKGKETIGKTIGIAGEKLSGY